MIFFPLFSNWRKPIFRQNCRFYSLRKNNLTGGVIKPTKALNFGIGLSFQRISRQILIRSAILHNQLIHPCKHTPLTTSLQPKNDKKKLEQKFEIFTCFWGQRTRASCHLLYFSRPNSFCSMVVKNHKGREIDFCSIFNYLPFEPIK